MWNKYQKGGTSMVTETKHPNQKMHIVFTWETWQRLLAFVTANYGGKRGFSLTVERAVREFLNSQDA